MLARLILPLPFLLLPLLAAPAGQSPARPPVVAAAATGTPTPSPTAAATSATPATQASAAVSTASAGGSNATASPDWAGLPVRTYANLKKQTPGDPINIAFEGTQGGIVAAFKKIGWVQADPLSVRNDTRLARAAIAHRSYSTAPVSNLYLFGRAEDFAVEHEIGTVSRRDHARFWDTTRRDQKNGMDLYVGDASRDIAIKILRTKKGLPRGTTHKIDGNLDQERDMIVTLMRKAGVVATVIMEPGMGRATNAVNGGGDSFYTDGKVAVIVLKNK